MDRKTIGRYEILGELGRGAMGSVLRARDPAMGREVALKCILSAALAGDQMAEFRERFYREARAAGALAHPGIVPVFDVGEDDGVPFLVMELVQGRTLDAALKQGERHSLDRVCEIGQQIADALGYAHRNGVIHRDIKPANILMTSREIYGAERPRITDFGVAKLAGGEATTTGQLLGTPAFMPPEQFTGGVIDGRTDLFALGVILYRMTTGEQPFPGETLTAVSYKVVHTEPISPSKLNPAIPKELEAVILRCLAKSPAERYQTGDELAADLAANVAAVRPGPRTSGQFATVTGAINPQISVAETIDQVSSLRPRQAATTMASAPTVVSGAQGRPVIPAAPPTPPVPPPAAPPVQTFGGTTQAWPVHAAAPPAQPAPAPAAPQNFARSTEAWPVREAAPPQTPILPPQPPTAPPAQAFAPSTQAWPVREAAPPPIPAQVPAAPQPYAPPRNYTPPNPAPPQSNAPPSPAPPVQFVPAAVPPPRPAPPAPPPALVPTSAASAPAAMRTYTSAQHPDATLRPARVSPAEASMMSTRSGRISASRSSPEPAPAKKRGMGVFTWLILIALGVGGTWLFRQIHVQQAPLPGVDVTQPAATGGATTAAVDFNPKTLDPSTNAQLTLDLDALPSALQVTVQMDGKTYWSGTAGDHDSYSGLMAPPGRHTLRVVVSGGGAQKASGVLSGDFAAGKKMTLTVKLWPQNNGVFDPSSDVVVSLERNLFGL